MNRRLLLASAIVLLVIGAGVLYVLFQKNVTIGSDEINVESSEMQTNPQPELPNATTGKYVEYTEDSFASAKGERLLFFHAPWCPQCRALDESIKASELPSGLTIFKVDYDSNQLLRAKYGVTLQTTVVKVDEGGNKSNSFVAYDEPTFQSVKRALLP